MDPVDGAGAARSARWTRVYAQESLPLPARALAWVPALAIPVLIFAPESWRSPVAAAAIVAVLLYGWVATLAATRAAVLIPSLSAISRFAGDADEYVVALALTSLIRQPRPGPLADAFRDAIATVIADADQQSCADGHYIGCAHRRNISAWQGWLTSPGR